MKRSLEKIAKKILCLDILSTRNADVIRAALEEAYKVGSRNGRAAAKREGFRHLVEDRYLI